MPNIVNFFIKFVFKIIIQISDTKLIIIHKNLINFIQCQIFI
jgi:hypothetical protein